jgi:putative ABC transport system substrate-binding protein
MRRREVKRREFIALLGGATIAGPLAARAQQPTMPVVGFLHSGSPEQNVQRLAAYRKGLSDAGFVEGQNVAIEYRWSAGQNSKLPAMAADLIQRQEPASGTTRTYLAVRCLVAVGVPARCDRL